MKTLIVLAVVAVVLVVLFGPEEGKYSPSGDVVSTLKKTAEEQSYLVAIEHYENGSVNYTRDMEADYIGWGRQICAKLDEGKEYDVALTYSPGVPQDAFGRAAVTFLCSRHISKLPKLRS